MKFAAESDFTLSAVRNAYRTETATDPTIILEVYRGGAASPNEGELLLTQTTGQTSAEGIVVADMLDEPQSFSAGESFWIVYKYPEGITFPQGLDATATVRPGTYYASSDGGQTYSEAPLYFYPGA